MRFFVYADSPHPGSGFLTVDTGAHNFHDLIAGATLSDDDIIDVVEGSAIDDTSSFLVLNYNITFNANISKYVKHWNIKWDAEKFKKE